MKTNSLYPIIVSGNPEKAIAFYKNLGFEQKHDVLTLKDSHVYILSNGDMEIEIMEQVKNGPVDAPAGLYGMRMNVSDVDAAYRDLQEKGCTVVVPPFEMALGKSMIIRDADGVNITLMQHIKR